MSVTRDDSRRFDHGTVTAPGSVDVPRLADRYDARGNDAARQNAKSSDVAWQLPDFEAALRLARSLRTASGVFGELRRTPGFEVLQPVRSAMLKGAHGIIEKCDDVDPLLTESTLSLDKAAAALDAFDESGDVSAIARAVECLKSAKESLGDPRTEQVNSDDQKPARQRQRARLNRLTARAESACAAAGRDTTGAVAKAKIADVHEELGNLSRGIGLPDRLRQQIAEVVKFAQMADPTLELLKAGAIASRPPILKSEQSSAERLAKIEEMAAAGQLTTGQIVAAKAASDALTAALDGRADMVNALARIEALPDRVRGLFCVTVQKSDGAVYEVAQKLPPALPNPLVAKAIRPTAERLAEIEGQRNIGLLTQDQYLKVRQFIGLVTAARAGADVDLPGITAAAQQAFPPGSRAREHLPELFN